jgi:hypothetical protein
MIAHYDHIQELRAELRGCVMTRRERAIIEAELARAIALSLSIRSCGQTTLRWSGCRSLIPPRFSSSRQPSPFRVRAHFAL